MKMMMFLFVGLMVVGRGEEVAPKKEDRTNLWIRYVVAVYEGNQFLGGNGFGEEQTDKLVGRDPSQFEEKSVAIKKAKAKLVESGELVAEEFSLKSLDAFFEASGKNEEKLSQLFGKLEDAYGDDVARDLSGIDFDLEVKRRDLRISHQFDIKAPFVLRTALPRELSGKFRTAIAPYLSE